MIVKKVIKDGDGYLLEIVVKGEVVRMFVANIRDWVQ